MSGYIKIIIVILVTVATCVKAQRTNLERGLLAYYSFDKDLNDQSGFNNNGTANGAELDPELRCGNGVVKFDGIDDYIDFGNPAELNRAFPGMTVSFMIFPTKVDADDFQLVVGKWAFNAKRDQFAVFMTVQNKLTFTVADGIVNENGVYSRTRFQPYQWYHIIMVWNRSGKVGIFVNGELDNTGEQTGRGYNQQSDISLKAGRQIVREDRPYEGYLDELRIYNRSLSLEEMRALYLQDMLPCNQFTLSGFVYNKNTNEPVGGANIIFEDLVSGNQYVNILSDQESGFYLTKLPIGYDFSFYAQAENYIAINDSISTKRVKQNAEIQKNLYLVPLEVGGTVRLNNIFFEFDKAILKEESFPELDRLLEILNQIPKLVIEIGGHTDALGSDDYNRTLSDARANAVRDYLLENGINQERVTAVGYGESVPVDTNDTEEGRAQNRRVEFKIISKD